MNTQPLAPAVPAAMPSQDDRLLAAFAHLSFLTGFWLIAPIAIYFLKRKESRFVAFQALQAVFVQLFWCVMMTCSVFVVTVLTMGASLSSHHELSPLFALLPTLGMLGGGLGLLGLHGLAAYRAWCGRDWSIPVAGGMARAVQAADEGAVRA